MRILGIDYGEKRIGIAISDPLQTVALGIGVIERSGKLKGDIKKIRDIIEKYGGVDEIVIGLPKTLKGKIGMEAEIVLKFIEDIKKVINVPLVTWDERLSTVAAERPLREAHISRLKRKKVIDESAAVFMLQGYLDRKRQKSL